MFGYYDQYRSERRKTPSPDFEADRMVGWKNRPTGSEEPTPDDLHPSQTGRRRFEDGPYKAAAKKRSWQIPKKAHPLSHLLAQLAQPKFCSSKRWIEKAEEGYYRSLTLPRLEHMKLFSTEDGTPLGTIRALDLDAVRKLAKASPFGMGSQTMYDEAVRRGREVRASQLQLGLVKPLSPPGRKWLNTRDGAWYFSDIAFQVGRFLFPGARSVKLVLYKLAIYSPGGHFKMHKDTTHADSHVGTVLIGCGVAQDDYPGDEELERMDYDFTQKAKRDSYTGGDLVILNDAGEEQRYHIRPGQVLAFCTDVPHAVDVVTSGVKLTLQFDVYLEDQSVMRENTVACVDLADWDAFYAPIPWDSESESGKVGEDETPIAAAPPSPPVCPSCHCPGCVASEESVLYAFSRLEDDSEGYWAGEGHAERFNSYEDDVQKHWRSEERAFGRYPIEPLADGLERFVTHIVALLQKAAPTPGPDDCDAYIAPRTVAFLLSHMYRKCSIRPEYLKTIDAAIYQALVASGKLRVILHHVTYKVDWSESGIHDNHLAICPPYAPGFSLRDIAEPVLCLHRPGSDSMDLRTEQDEMIARGEIYVGNEAFEEPAWYVAGAIFVSRV
ncbi:hypothetical protein AURDEDRAFT_169676 [Auricularia subglabra TFB-10046 SS5]|nr:hypothetical protein AURDEDRAFT_169676 [Auricularia subglabra TFB-10046 SS5]